MRWLTSFLILFLFIFSYGMAFDGKGDRPPAARELKVPKLNRVSYAAAQTKRVRPLIILDAGHGGNDEGAKVQAFKEKRATLTTAMMTKRHLEELGYRVVMTRSRDVYLSLEKRVSIANKTQGTLFVSIHFNASKYSEASGVEVYYCNAEAAWRAHASKRLASCVLHHLINQTDAHSRGVKSGNFHVIRETEMPAILVEGGFVTNWDECSLLKKREYLDKIASGIAQGVDKYLK